MPRYEVNGIPEILEMLSFQNLDIRAVTLGDQRTTLTGIRWHKGIISVIEEKASGFREAVDTISRRLGVKIMTKRLAVTPPAT